jgi:hypothetical protein
MTPSIFGTGAPFGTNTLIAHNDIQASGTDVALMNDASYLTVQFNRLSPGGSPNVGIATGGSTTDGSSNVVFGGYNWWGCANGPSTPSCSRLSSPNYFNPIFASTFLAAPPPVKPTF